MTSHPSFFDTVRLPTFEPNASSPEAPEDVEGLWIALPTRVTLEREGDSLVVCGTYRMRGTTFNELGSVVNEIVLVAVDADTHAPRSGNLRQGDESPAPAGFDTDDPDLADTWVTGWFNVDLFAIIPDLPREAARYRVFATIGTLRSTVSTAEVQT